MTHHSYAAQATAIKPSNAASLAEAWHFVTGAPPVKARGYNLNASPTVYDGVVYIGGNNGTLHAINESTGAVVWHRAIGYVAGTATTIGGTSYPASIDELNAATGAIVWASGLPSQVLGTPSLDGGGVLAVGTFADGSDPEADYLLKPSSGAILATVSNGDSSQFAQPFFAGQYLFIATDSAGLYAYKPPAQASRAGRQPLR